MLLFYLAQLHRPTQLPPELGHFHILSILLRVVLIPHSTCPITATNVRHRDKTKIQTQPAWAHGENRHTSHHIRESSQASLVTPCPPVCFQAPSSSHHTFEIQDTYQNYRLHTRRSLPPNMRRLQFTPRMLHLFQLAQAMPTSIEWHHPIGV